MGLVQLTMAQFLQGTDSARMRWCRRHADDTCAGFYEERDRESREGDGGTGPKTTADGKSKG
jgi:hypothetical protein